MSAPPTSIANELPPASAMKRADPYAFNPATNIPSLASKVILITGANTGIGKQVALDLSKHEPAQIWIAARSPSSGQAAVDEIKIASPSVDVRFVELDLTSFDSIKKAARKVLQTAQRLDILNLNAGIMGGERVLRRVNRLLTGPGWWSQECWYVCMVWPLQWLRLDWVHWNRICASLRMA